MKNNTQTEKEWIEEFDNKFANRLDNNRYVELCDFIDKALLDARLEAQRSLLESMPLKTYRPDEIEDYELRGINAADNKVTAYILGTHRLNKDLSDWRNTKLSQLEPREE